MATNPTDNSVRVRTSDVTTRNIGALDNAAVWEAWADFGIPDGGAGAQIMSVTVTISNDGFVDDDAFAVMIVARMDDGTVYIRTTDDDARTLAQLDDPAQYGAWVSLGDPGFL